MSAQTQAIEEGCPNCKIPLIKIKGECILDVPESLLDHMIELSKAEPDTPIFTEINAICPLCGYIITTGLSQNDYDVSHRGGEDDYLYMSFPVDLEDASLVDEIGALGRKHLKLWPKEALGGGQ